MKIQTNDHTIGFVEEVAIILQVNITYYISESYVYGITFVYLSIIVRISFEYRVNENVNGTVTLFERDQQFLN